MRYTNLTQEECVSEDKNSEGRMHHSAGSHRSLRGSADMTILLSRCYTSSRRSRNTMKMPLILDLAEDVPQ